MSLGNKERKLRVMVQSNPPWTPSGYSNVNADMERLFTSNGWNTNNFALINMFGQSGGKFKDQYQIWNFPLINHTTGSDAMLHHSRYFKSDIIIALQDQWTMNPQDLSQVSGYIPYVPIDYDPVPMGILGNMRFAKRIISMSKFGQKQLADHGFSSTLIYHGVDQKIFKPLDKMETRKKLGITPDVFIFGMISANQSNPPRKSFQEVLEAFKRFLKAHPKSLLYIHTDPDMPGGFPLKQYAAYLEITNNVFYPEFYKNKFDTSKEQMNEIFNTFDVLLCPSAGEGFGLPIAEAQMAGIPVIVNDWTAMPEMILDKVTGYVVKHQHPKWYPIGSYMAWPDVDDLYAKMMYIKNMDLTVMGKAAHNWAAKTFDLQMLWDTRWMPFLQKLEDEKYGLDTTIKNKVNLTHGKSRLSKSSESTASGL